MSISYLTFILRGQRGPMGVLDKIEKKDIRDLLGKGWLTHDGLWFYHTCQELGIERTNALNQAAIKSLAPIEIERAKRILGMGQKKINDFDMAYSRSSLTRSAA